MHTTLSPTAESGPDNWWVRKKDGGEKDEGETGAVQSEEEEVVDFTMLGDKESNKRKREETSSDDDDASSNGEDDNNAGRDESGGRKTMSIDQSLFSSSDANLDVKGGTLPQFSCSPVAMKSSQAASIDSIDDEDGRQTASASQLDRVLMPSSAKGNTKSPSPSTVPVEDAASKKQSASCKKQHTSTSTQPIKSSLSPQPKPRRTNRVSFQQQPRVMLLNPSWTLSNEHTRCLRKCVNDGFVSILKMHPDDDNEDEFDSGFDFDTEEGRESFLATLSSNKTDNCPPAPLSFYAISTENDPTFSFDGAIIVPRSFPYYLSVACGLPIVDIGFLSSAANMKRRGTTSHQRYPFPPIDEKSRGQSNQNDFVVLGASNYTWESPKNAQAAALERHSLWLKGEGIYAQSETLLPGTGLLSEYNVLLLGEFDAPNHSKRTVAKRRKQSETKGGGYCTRGNISLLLQLCGAKVYDIDSVIASKHIKKGLMENELTDVMNAKPLGDTHDGATLNDTLQSTIEGKIIVMVNEKSDAKMGSDFLSLIAPLTQGKASQIPVVSCQWLLDSIGEYKAQETKKYDFGGAK